jgi:hypothetical protein
MTKANVVNDGEKFESEFPGGVSDQGAQISHGPNVRGCADKILHHVEPVVNLDQR